jgi:hypothetical protein
LLLTPDSYRDVDNQLVKIEMSNKAAHFFAHSRTMNYPFAEKSILGNFCGAIGADALQVRVLWDN